MNITSESQWVALIFIFLVLVSAEIWERSWIKLHCCYLIHLSFLGSRRFQRKIEVSFIFIDLVLNIYLYMCIYTWFMGFSVLEMEIFKLIQYNTVKWTLLQDSLPLPFLHDSILVLRDWPTAIDSYSFIPLLVLQILNSSTE